MYNDIFNASSLIFHYFIRKTTNEYMGMSIYANINVLTKQNVFYFYNEADVAIQKFD